tara:strand:- start:1487 stop:1633 length:147 start_codon:yes stop_codon:yes gene_type:complete
MNNDICGRSLCLVLALSSKMASNIAVGLKSQSKDPIVCSKNYGIIRNF